MAATFSVSPDELREVDGGSQVTKGLLESETCLAFGHESPPIGYWRHTVCMPPMSPMHPMQCPVLVGRDAELETLTAALVAATHGRGQVVLIVGEPGIGKSRLARELAAVAQARNVTVITGRAAAESGPVAFRPVTEALLGAFRTRPPPEAPEFAPFRPAVSRLLPHWRVEDEAVAEASSVIVNEGVLRLLRLLAGDSATLMVLEDLHWADPETLALVEYLADNLGSEPVLCLATLRQEEPGPAAAAARTLHRRRSATFVELTRFGPGDVATMARACLQADSLPELLTGALHVRAEGVPFVVEELLAASAEAGLLRREGGGWRLDPDHAAVVPVSLSDSVHARLTRLGKPAQQVLTAAAVLGRHFDWTLLPDITGHGGAAVLEALRSAVASHLLEPVEGQPDLFRFRHALTRDAVLKGLLPPERVALANRALEAVEEAQPDPEGRWLELAADLALQSGQRGRAAVLLLDAARVSLSRGALSTVEETLDRARRLVVGDRLLTIEIDEALSDALALAGKTARVFEVGESLIDNLERIDAAPSRLGDAHLRVARAATAAGDWATAQEQINAARRFASHAETGLAARADALAAHVALGEGRLGDAEALARAALAAAERADTPEVACEALEALGRIARERDLKEAEALFEHARALAEEHDLTIWRVRALHELCTIDVLETLRLDRLQVAREAAVAAGAVHSLAVVDLHFGCVLVTTFEEEAALEAVRRCAAISRRFGLGVLPIALILEADIAVMQGAFTRAEEVLAEVLALEPDPWDEAEVWGCRAMIALVQEDRRTALEYLERSAEELRRAGTKLASPYVGLWAVLSTVAGRDDARHELRAAATVTRWNRGLFGYADAVALGRAGETEAAAAAFAAADRAMRSPVPIPWYGNYARRLVAEAAIADGWGEPIVWLREAEAFFTSARQARLATGCRSLLRKAGVPLPRRGRGDSEVPTDLRSLGVTSREMDVLLLVAEGLSNRDIAARLYLSPRTVEKHVERLAAKTGHVSRAQLVAFAAGRRTGD